MKLFIKSMLILSVITILLGLAESWYNMFFLGKYWVYASFIPTVFVGVILPTMLTYLSILAIYQIVKYK